MKTILLVQISLERSPFVRAGVNQETVEEYAELYRSKKSLPEPDVFIDEAGEILLADGRHRIEAAQAAGLESLKCEVHEGGYSEALRFALGSNAEHGLRRSNEDKRVCVTEALKEWPRLSNPQLAEICAVSERYVCIVRRELEASKEIRKTTTRICSDGRVIPTNNSGVGKSQLGTKPDNTPKPMPARLIPGAEIEHVTPPPPMPVLHHAAAAPHLIQRVQCLVRDFLRLPHRDPAFQKCMSQLLAFQKHVQGELPGMAEHFAAAKARGSKAEVESYCVTIGLPSSDGTWFFDKAEGCGWKNNGKAIVDWKATCRAWKGASVFPSQKVQRGVNRPEALQDKHWSTKQADAELAHLKATQADFEKRSAALRRSK